MKNFKKILTLLILLIGITSQAQIRQDILGTTLGITTKQRAARIILDKGYGISGSGNIMTVHDADFAGYIWNDTSVP